MLSAPPEPFILTSCVSSTEVQVYWHLPHDWQPLHGLPVDFELEICRHATHNALRHDTFVQVYRGPRSSHHIAQLQCDTMYSLRCRAVNRMKKSKWSSVVRFITLQQVSLAWRLRHCTSVTEAIRRMRQQKADPKVQFRSVQWVFAQLEKREEVDRSDWEVKMDGVRDNRGEPDVTHQLQLEQELLDCHGLEVLLDSLGWFPSESVTTALILRLLLKLLQLRKSTRHFLTESWRFQVLCDLLRSHTLGNTEPVETREENVPSLQVPLLCLQLLGVILDENTAAKLVFQSCSGVEHMLSYLELDPYRHQAAVVAECCYILAVFSYQNGTLPSRPALAYR